MSRAPRSDSTSRRARPLTAASPPRSLITKRIERRSIVDETRAHYWRHGTGWFVPGRAAAREGLRGLRDGPPFQLVQHRAAGPHLPGSARPGLQAAAGLWRPRRRQLAEPRAAFREARRDLQPGCAEPRARELRRAGVHGVDRRPRHAAVARVHPRVRPREVGALLSGVVERDVRRGQAAAAVSY